MSEKMTENGLVMWTVFDHPSDYPDHFVVRAFLVTSDGVQPAINANTFPTLEDARRPLIMAGLACITRSPEDDPVIVETWL